MVFDRICVLIIESRDYMTREEITKRVKQVIKMEMLKKI